MLLRSLCLFSLLVLVLLTLAVGCKHSRTADKPAPTRNTVVQDTPALPEEPKPTPVDDTAAKWAEKTGIVVTTQQIGPRLSGSGTSLNVAVYNANTNALREVWLYYGLYSDDGKKVRDQVVEFRLLEAESADEVNWGFEEKIASAKLEKIACGKVTGAMTPPEKPGKLLPITPAVSEKLKKSGVVLDEYGMCIRPDGKSYLLCAARNSSGQAITQIAISYEYYGTDGQQTGSGYSTVSFNDGQIGTFRIDKWVAKDSTFKVTDIQVEMKE